MSTTRLTDLARALLENATLVENHLNAQGSPLPSFAENGPPELALSPEAQRAQQIAMEKAIELQDLLTGPANLLRPTLNGTALHAIYTWNIASKVPLGGQISLPDLAREVGLKQADLQRIVRFAIVHHRVFQEKTPGIISHSAASRLLAEDESAMAGLGFMFDECYQSFAHTVESLTKFENAEAHQTGWALARNTDVSMWDYYTTHPDLGQRTALAMASFTKGFGHDTSALSSYDWTPIDQAKGLIVDMGGADGSLAIELARKNQNTNFLVQDIPSVIARFASSVPADVRSRIKFQTHDFLTPQPVTADLYFFRQIFHDWPETQSIKILRALIPALKPGAKVLVNDTILPSPGTLPLVKERAVRSIDMIVMSLFNAREREEEHWRGLFAEADERFRDVRVWQPEGSQMGLIEATWRP